MHKQCWQLYLFVYNGLHRKWDILFRQEIQIILNIVKLTVVFRILPVVFLWNDFPLVSNFYDHFEIVFP